MKKILFKCFFIVVILMNASVITYADETSTKPQNSNINFRIEERDSKYIINYENIFIDPENVDALLAIDGKIITENYAVLKDGFSLIPLRVVSDALGIGIEWNKDDRSILMEKDNKKILLYIDETTATIDGAEVELDVPAQIIDSSTYVPARFVAENMNCTIQFDNNVFILPEKYDNLQNKTNIPIVSIEQKSDFSVTPMTQEEAVAIVKTKVSTIFYENYSKTKSNQDINLFKDEVAYKAVAQSMGRFYRVEVHFYDQWSKRFESYAYVDRYTRQLYLGDHKFGLTEDVTPYFIQKFENHLAIENRPTKIIPFTEMKLLTDSAFVNVNFPEQIHDNALLETYYNHVDSIKDSGRVFLSHKNDASQTIDYIIRFKNELDSETKLSIIEDKAIHTTEQYQDQVIKAHMDRLYKRKLANQSEEIVLKPGDNFDTVIKNIEDGQFFTGIVDFHASNHVSITVFAVPSAMADPEENYNKIPSPTIMFDYDFNPKTFAVIPESTENISEKDKYYTTYSGLGEGYQLEAKGSLKASDMMKKSERDTAWNIAFETGGSLNNLNQRNGLSEMVEIELVEPRGENNEITKAVWSGNIVKGESKRDELERMNKNAPGNYGNLGNWGIEYLVTVQLNNDTDTDKIFGCEIVPVNQTTWAFLVDGNVAVTNLNNKKYMDTLKRKTGVEIEQIQIGSGIKSGRIGSVVVKAHEKKELSYTYVLGTDCESNVFHVWTCIEAE